MDKNNKRFALMRKSMNFKPSTYDSSSFLEDSIRERGGLLVQESSSSIFIQKKLCDSSHHSSIEMSTHLVAIGSLSLEADLNSMLHHFEGGSANSQIDVSATCLNYPSWKKDIFDQIGDMRAADLALDRSGNCYIVGHVEIKVDCHMENDRTSYFITKLDMYGNVLWTQKPDVDDENSVATCVCVSDGGMIFVGGYKTNTETRINDNRAGFIMACNASGNKLWSRDISFSNYSERTNDICVDKEGHIIIVGETNQRPTDNPASYSITYFVARFDVTGKLIWVRRSDSRDGVVKASSVSINAQGCITIAGYTGVNLEGQTQHGILDCFVARYDLDGELKWIRQMGQTGGISYCAEVDVDERGSSIVVGSTNVALLKRKRAGYFDYFIMCFDSSGILLWAKEVGGAGGIASAESVCVDMMGNSFIAGYTTSGLSKRKQNGIADCFVAKYNAQGNLIWLEQLGIRGSSSKAFSICANKGGNGALIGYDMFKANHQ